eukprot:TRINITY_DN43813_c0_g1_i1.p1 TRINITY_DN43813_c0_g1~~TRINITY_DN43813_c0_g1_i1.p1  ORF type:complete len:592 (+),score=182.00 TRINITY_DN43813_c0_g1_i1:75-1850(+)
MGGDRRDRDRDRRRRDRRRRRRSSSPSSTDSATRRKRRRKAEEKKRQVEALTSGWKAASAAAAAPAAAAAAAPGNGALVVGAMPSALVHRPIITGGIDPVAARAARRLFVGNIDQAMSEMMLRNFFKMHGIALRRKLYEAAKRKAQDMMRDPSTIPAPMDAQNPVLDCALTRGEAGKAGFAFVEMESEELTTECLSLDGKSCPLPDGRVSQLRVSRPKNYVEAAPSASSDPGAEKRLVMRGYPTHMRESDVRPLLESIGVLSAFDFLRDAAGRSRGTCLFEFANAGDDVKCIAVTNGQDLGSGYRLVVERLSDSKDLTISGIPRRDVDAEKKLLQNLINLAMPLHQALHALAECFESLRPRAGFLVGAFPVRPTRFLCLLNLFSDDELEDEDEYDQLFADIEQECERWGRVVKINIPRDTPPVPKAPEKPPPPKPLLTHEVQHKITDGPAVPPTLDPKSGVLIVTVQRPEDAAKAVDQENRRRKQEWEERCEQIDKDYEEAIERWEKEMADPVKNGVGKVIVEYLTPDEAHKAQMQMAGRQFGGRTVITTFLPDDWVYPPKPAPSMEEILKSLEGPQEVLPIEDRPAGGRE